MTKAKDKTKDNEPEVQIAEPTFLGDLMEMVLQELKLVQKPWQELSERQQKEILFRIERQAKAMTRKAIAILAAGDHTTVKAAVDSVTFKDGAKAVLKSVIGSGQGFHTLADCANEGAHVLVVLPDDSIADQEHEHEADPDQGELPVGDGE